MQRSSCGIVSAAARLFRKWDPDPQSFINISGTGKVTQTPWVSPITLKFLYTVAFLGQFCIYFLFHTFPGDWPTHLAWQLYELMPSSSQLRGSDTGQTPHRLIATQGHSASQAGSAVHTGLHLCCFTVPAGRAAVQVCHAYTYSWRGTVQWGSEPTQTSAPPTTHSSVSVARVTPQTGGVSLIHLLCTSANISVIFGSDTLLVSDPEITSLLKTTRVGGKFGCSSMTMVFLELKSHRHWSQSTMSPRSSRDIFSCWCTTNIHLEHKHITMCSHHINSLGHSSEVFRISTTMISEAVFWSLQRLQCWLFTYSVFCCRYKPWMQKALSPSKERIQTGEVPGKWKGFIFFARTLESLGLLKVFWGAFTVDCICFPGSLPLHCSEKLCRNCGKTRD